MATKKPICNYSGELKELQAGDDIPLTGAVLESDYTPSHSILVQQSGTGSPTVLQIGNNTLVGRLSGGGSNIDDLSPSDVFTLLGITSTAAELNILDGATLSTTELNFVDGVTSAIQTQIDGKQATLVSATNIKTINGNSILGAGDLVIPALTDGDKGDITVSASGATWTIDNLAVTNAKINDVAWSKISSTPTTLSGYGISDAQPLDATLTALAGLNTTAGVVVQTGTDTFTKRTLTGTTNQITVTNGNGGSGNPTISLPSNLVDVDGISSSLIIDYGYNLTLGGIGFYDNAANITTSYGLGGVSLSDNATSSYAYLTPNYLNFGGATGSSGFGLRNNSGTIEVKNNGGSWSGIDGGFVMGAYRTNGYFFGAFNTSSVNTSATLAANTLYAVPFIVTDTTTFTRIGINVTTLSTGNARLGIYNYANGAPTTLVLDAGTVSVASTGEKEITISQALSAGAYAVVVICNGTPLVRRGAAVTAAISTFGYPNSSSAVATHITQSMTYAALNSSFGTPTYVTDGTNLPAIWLRKV